MESHNKIKISPKKKRNQAKVQIEFLMTFKSRMIQIIMIEMNHIKYMFFVLSLLISIKSYFQKLFLVQ